MKKLILSVLTLSLISLTSCRNEETTEVSEEISKETAINSEVSHEMHAEVEDSIQVEAEEVVDSLDTTSEVIEDTEAIQ